MDGGAVALLQSRRGASKRSYWRRSARHTQQSHPIHCKGCHRPIAGSGRFRKRLRHPDGTGVRDYIHVVDLAKGHVAAIEGAAKPAVYVYNLGTGKGYSVLQVIDAFGRACGRKLPYTIKPRRPGDIAACYADASKAQKELGWKAELGLDEMCSSLWNWQKKNPKGFKD